MGGLETKVAHGISQLLMKLGTRAAKAIQSFADNEDMPFEGTKFGSSLECAMFLGVQLKVCVANISGTELQSIQFSKECDNPNIAEGCNRGLHTILWQESMMATSNKMGFASAISLVIKDYMAGYYGMTGWMIVILLGILISVTNNVAAKNVAPPRSILPKMIATSKIHHLTQSEQSNS